MSGELSVALNVIYEAFKALHKDDSEKFEKQWREDLPKLTKAVKEGDIETIKEITAKYYEI